MARNTSFSLTLADCYLDFPRFTLDVPEFTIPAGTTTALLGPSGSGKSTILNCMGMLEHKGKYRILMDGKEVGPKQVHGRVTAVFQRPYLMKGTIADNVAYGLALRGANSSLKKERTAEMLELVGLEGRGKETVKSLSGGEAQRVALARALAVEPAALLLDEPLASLDIALKRYIAREFATILEESNTTALYITHDVNEALVVADNIAIVIDGRIIAAGPIREVISIVTNPDVAEFLNVDVAFAAEVKELKTKTAVLSTPFGDLFARRDEHKIGERLFCAIKPEDIKVRVVGRTYDDKHQLGRNHIQAELKEIKALGMTQQLVFEYAGNTLSSLVSFALHDERDFKVGEEYLLSFSYKAVQTLPEDRALAHNVAK